MDIETALTLGYPLTREQILPLAQAPLPELGRFANRVRERLHANLVYFRSEPLFTLEERFPLAPPAEWVDRLFALRDPNSGRSLCFLPLVEQTGLHTTGGGEIRLIALSRLILNTVPHIAAHWTHLTEPIAQVALRFGADEIQAWPSHLPGKELQRQVEQAGRELFPCNSRYQPAPLAQELFPVVNA